MSRTITFQREVAYLRRIYDGEVVWSPEVNAEFRTDGGEARRGRAILDSGSPWCAMPRDVAAFLGIDVGALPRQRLMPVGGGVTLLPYAYLTVRLFGHEAMCKVLLNDAGPYLIGRLPFFAEFDFAFHEEQAGEHSRILVGEK